MADIKISEMTTAATLNGTEVSVLSQSQGGQLVSVKATLQAIANWFAVNAEYTSALNTTDKRICGAINELKQLISLIPQFSIEVVQVLPTEEISDTTIYLVPAEDPEVGNYYEEYIHVNDSWELVGTTAVDLSDYYTKAQADGKFVVTITNTISPTTTTKKVADIKQNNVTTPVYADDADKILRAAFGEHTATGNPVSVDAFLGLEVVSSCKVTMLPIQDISQGDPSPTNICPISGRDSVNVENDPYYPYSVVWNQLIKNGNFTDNTNWNERNTGNLTIADGKCTLTALNGNATNQIYQNMTWLANHVYMVLINVISYSGSFTTLSIGFYNGTTSSEIQSVQKSSLTANWGMILKPSANSGSSSNFRIGFRTNNAQGDKLVMDNIMIFDLTVMFGTSVADSIYAMEQTTAGSGVAKCREYGIIKEYYAYNSGEETYMGLVNDEWHYSNSHTYSTTVYGGVDDFVSGVGSNEWGYIASYNGETLPDIWLSDRDAYAPNTTPTTGAEVVYKLATPTQITNTPEDITLLKGVNVVSTDGDSLELKYSADIKAYIDSKLNA